MLRNIFLTTFSIFFLSAACLPLLGDEVNDTGPAKNDELPADSSDSEAAEKPDQIEQNEPAFYVRASLNKASGVYDEQDFVSIKVVSEKDAYVYIMYTQTDGKVYQIFPNSVHKDNFVEAKKPVQLGARGDLFRWIVSKPFGKESVSVIASVEPIQELSKREQIARQFNPVSAKQIKGVQTVLAESIWTSTHVPLETREKPPEPVEPPAKRVGLFVGVSKHMFHDEGIAAAKQREPDKEHSGPNVDGPDVSAKLISELMRSDGSLDEIRVLVNEQATRDQIEEAFTKWLPNNTKPGDTIFLYHSGHTGQFPDDNGDERDELDELMTTYDTISPGEFNYIRKLQLAGKLSATKNDRFRALLGQIGRANFMQVSGRMNDVQQGDFVVQEALRRGDESMLDRIGSFISRETRISDDLIGRWLQRLDGRRVVVIFDTCFSGGYANVEKSLVQGQTSNHKSLTRPSGWQALDFLDSEVSRLKDIGQRDLALMASSSVTQSSRVIQVTYNGKELPYMGQFSTCFYLALEAFDSPANAVDVYQKIEDIMEKANKGKKEPQRSHFFNDLTEPVFFKPHK